MEEKIESKCFDIKRAMAKLGRRLEKNDNSQLLHWVIPEKLCCAHRPLRHDPLYGGSGRNLDNSATDLVLRWGEEVQANGIKSIICLMHDRDIGYYDTLDLNANDLIEFYEKLGFVISHIPWEDPHHKKSSPENKRKRLLKVRKKALAAYDNLPKPVLVQCSAGIDRSSPVTAFIWAMRTR